MSLVIMEVHWFCWLDSPWIHHKFSSFMDHVHLAGRMAWTYTHIYLIFQIWKARFPTNFLWSTAFGGRVSFRLILHCKSSPFSCNEFHLWWCALKFEYFLYHLQVAICTMLWWTSVWCMGWSAGGWSCHNFRRAFKFPRWKMGVAAQGCWQDSI